MKGEIAMVKCNLVSMQHEQSYFSIDIISFDMDTCFCV